MCRVFLDANVLFSAAYRPESPLRRLWALPGVTIVTSAYAAAEAWENLPEAGAERTALEALLTRTEVQNVGTGEGALARAPVLPDATDVPILLGAIEARADYLLTGDGDFAAFFGKAVQGVTVLRPRDFFRLREGGAGFHTRSLPAVPEPPESPT